MRLPPRFATLAVATLLAAPAGAQQVNTGQLSENGWFSDDTRADGTATAPVGQNLISPSLTDAPEGAAPAATAADDDDILNQIVFGAAPTAPPAGTWLGAVNLRDQSASSSAKSQISHRKDDGVGHFPGSALDATFTAEYSWVGFGTPTTTAAFKLGIKTSDFGATGVSSRTGENAWDKVLIYEPGQGNGNDSDGTWYTESIDWSNGNWWFFDRTTFGSIQSTPMTLEALSTSAMLVPGGGGQTVADIFAKMTAPGAHVTSVQFGIGSNNPGADVYVNQLACSDYRPGEVTTFGTPSPFDQDVTPDAIFGAGNANGSFTVSRTGGVELGLRAKQRFPVPGNVFNSNGDGSYTWPAGIGQAPDNAFWAWEWSVNTDPDGASGRTLDGLTYELGIDYDPSGDTNYLVFDPITPTVSVPAWDHSLGDNTTPNGGGVEFPGDPVGYAAGLASFNVAQNSWRHTFFDDGFATFDPSVPGRYDLYLAAFDGGEEIGRVAITIFAVDGTTLSLEADDLCQTDQDPVLPGVQVVYTLNLRNANDADVTGFQAFLAFDDAALTFEPSASAYDDSSFGTHITPMAAAETSAGRLTLDGNVGFPATPVDGDAPLATLVFTVSDCDVNSIAFDGTGPFLSELSIDGSPLTTGLLDSPDVVGDGTAPVIAPQADILQAADAGSCAEAVVTFALPAVTDNCDPNPTVVCDPPSGSVFPVGTTTVTCTATDECGNVSVSTFDVTVTATNLVDVTVQLVGSQAATRCILFVPDDCGAETSATLNFVDIGGGIAEATATIELPCGVYTQLCAKDQQHTLWDTVTITNDGDRYSVDATLVLQPGDTDDDGDVDINDVTLFLAQFGNPAQNGGCAWDGTRDADFDNNGFVQTPDYSALVANWLNTSDCVCTAPASGEGVRERTQRVARVTDAVTRRADLNADGQVDWKDVRLFESRSGLPHELSNRMRRD